MKLPPDAHLWNRAIRGAFKKGESMTKIEDDQSDGDSNNKSKQIQADAVRLAGMWAHRDGKPLDSCPYPCVSRQVGGFSWAWVFRHEWLEGWWDHYHIQEALEDFRKARNSEESERILMGMIDAEKELTKMQRQFIANQLELWIELGGRPPVWPTVETLKNWVEVLLKD